MRTTTRRTPGPGQLVLVLPGIPTRPVVVVEKSVRQRQVKPTPLRVAPAPAPTPPRARPRPPVQQHRGPGELIGAAPTSRQVKVMTLRVEQLDGGKWRLTLPRIPAWGAVVATPAQLAVGIRSGFTEMQVAAYSDWKNCRYDLDVPDYRRRRPKRSAPMKNRRDVHAPTKWKEIPDGRWVSPSGLLYPADCQVVLRVRRKLFRQGLGLNPDDSAASQLAKGWAS